MQKITKAESFLSNLINHEIKLADLKKEDSDKIFGRKRFQDLLRSLGNPQSSFPSIQVAGSNGKGSTVNLLQNLFLLLGFRTGTFISPHLARIRERILLDGEEISDSQFIEALTRLEGQGRFTFFEAMTAAAFLFYRNSRVDIALLETGLGGRLDSTSYARAQIGVITSISLEHQHILGDTLEEILMEKLGILHRDMSLLLGNLPDKLLDLSRTECERRGKECFSLKKDYDLIPQGDHLFFSFPYMFSDPISIPVSVLKDKNYHQENFANALAALFIFLRRNHNLVTKLFSTLERLSLENSLENSGQGEAKFDKIVAQHIRNKLQEIFAALNRSKDIKLFSLAGRNELLAAFRYDDRKNAKVKVEFIFDGSHNPGGLQHFLKSCFREEKNIVNIVMFTSFKDKKNHEMLDMLLERNAYVVLWDLDDLFYLKRTVGQSVNVDGKAEGLDFLLPHHYQNRWIDTEILYTSYLDLKEGKNNAYHSLLLFKRISAITSPNSSLASGFSGPTNVSESHSHHQSRFHQFHRVLMHVMRLQRHHSSQESVLEFRSNKTEDQNGLEANRGFKSELRVRVYFLGSFASYPLLKRAFSKLQGREKKLHAKL